MANEKSFTPPADISWWIVKHKTTGKVAFGFARTAYFAVQEACFSNGYSCGWTLSECEVELTTADAIMQRPDYQPGQLMLSTNHA
jgi:hypothetical protein